MKYSPFIKIYFMLILTLMSLQADTPVSTKDFGDAPSNYPHVSHKISPNLYLGNSVPDSEFDQQSSADASGDGEDDSDGVTNFPTLTVGDSSYTIPVKVLNNTGEVATITAWIDFNRDGIFQYDEALNTNALNIPSSNSPQNVDVTWDNFTDGDTTAIDNAVAGKTIMRIRLTTHDSRILRCDSEHYSSNPNNGDYSDNYLVSPNGEVEDYEINIDTGMKPLPCEASAFMFNDQPTKTSLINLSDGNIKDAVSDLSTTELNGAGYNQKDGYIWGVDQVSADGTLIKIGLDDQGNYVSQRVKIEGESFDAYVGDVDDNGHLYLKTGDKNSNNVIVIDLDPNSNKYLTKINHFNLTKNLVIHDWAFNPVDDFLYAVTKEKNKKRDNKLYKIDPKDGTVTLVGNTSMKEINSNIGASFFDKHGNMYVYSNKSGIIYKIPVSQGKSKATPFSTTSKVTRNDGAMCADVELEPSQEPFTCSDALFISNRSELGTGDSTDTDTGATWLHSINRETSPYSYTAIGEGYTSTNNGYNAMGYNVKDNFIYSLYLNHLLKIDKNGVVKDLGEIDGLNPSQLYSGEFDRDGNLYVSIYGGGGDTLYKIDIDALKVIKPIPLKYKNGSTADIKFWDMAIDKTGDYFYMMIINYSVVGENESFAKLNISTGEITLINPSTDPSLGNIIGDLFGLTPSDLESGIAVVFSDKLGNVYAQAQEGGFYKVNTENGKLQKLSDTQPLTKFNDATSCPDAIIDFGEKDFGDAPQKYTHVSHKISKDLYLGNTVPDSEEDQQSSDDATGDGDDDNDAIVGSLPKLTVGNNSYTVPVKVFNNTGKIATITAWIDFNRDGIFQYDEALNTRNLEIPSSNSPQNVDITWDNTTDNETMAIENATAGSAIMRIRLSTSRILRCDDEHYKGNSDDVQDNYLISPDGEVEDYIIDIVDNKAYGRFNIERTNSGDFPIKTDERYAWYTQIVGRDFNYSIVFYNDTFTKEQNISNVTLDVDLMDMDKNESIYHYQFHVPDTIKKSRINILTDKDLDKLPATKNARFKVTYGVDDKGGIVMADCLTNPTVCTEHHSDLAKDNFAIRPEKFYVSIADGEKERVNSLSPNPISFAAGYEYNLSVKAIKYFKNHPDFNASEGYDGLSNRSLHFTTNGTSCRNIEDQDKEIRFNNGIYADTNFSNPFVGEYKLNIKEDNTWTEVDQNDRDCIKDNNSTSENPNEPSGCNITQVDDITINFQPDHFDVALNLGTVPASGHEDFVYMSELSPDYNNVAVQFTGKILAKNKNNDTTQNFTQHCVATNVLLDLNATTISTEGINQQVHTILGTPVNFTRYINYNSNSSHKTSEIIHTLQTLNGAINLGADKFLDENNGTVDLDMKYNLNKNLTEPTNPVQVTFNRMDASSTDANSVAYDKIHTQSDMHTPSGFKIFDNNVKNFYFARVVSKKDTYPQINMLINPTVRTPLFVDFYCKTDNANYCDERNVSNNSRMFETTREQKGWYVSTKHNGQLDGNVTALLPNNNIVTITENGADVTGTANNIMLNQGSNGTVTATFNNPGSVTIDISTSKVLRFDPSHYNISATDVNTSWTGVGIKASTLEIRPMDTPSKKMNW